MVDLSWDSIGNVGVGLLRAVVKYHWFKDAVWCFLLAAYCANTLIGSALLLCTLPYTTYLIFKNRFNKLFFCTFFFLLFFGILYALVIYSYNLVGAEEVIRVIYYPICLYVLGHTLVKNDYQYKKTYRYLYLVIVASVMYGFLSLYKTIGMYGNIGLVNSEESRAVINLWGNNLLVATGLNSYISLGLSLLPLVFLSDRSIRNKRFKIINLTLFSASIYTTIELANRTGLIIAIVSVITVFLFIKKSIKHIVNLLLVAFSTLGLKALYSQNVWGISSWWESTLMYYRLTTLNEGDDPRVAAWATAFRGMFSYPMGGRQSEISVGYAHNLWLDVGRDGGIAPFFLITMFTVVAIISIAIFIRLKHPVYLKGLVIAMCTSFFITFSLEPVIQGLMDYFTFFCFVVGIIQRINFDHKTSLVTQYPVNPMLQKNNVQTAI